MTLEVSVEQNQITLKLSKKNRTIDSETFLYYHDLSDMLTPLEVTDVVKKGFIIKGSTAIYGELLTGLITGFDKLLKRNSIDTSALKSFKMGGNIGENSTSYKIAASFVEALKIKT